MAKRYQIEKCGQFVRESARIDYARKYYEQEPLLPGQSKRLIDTHDGSVIIEGIEPAKEFKSKEPIRRTRDNNDPVAKVLRSLTIEQTVCLATQMLDHVATPLTHLHERGMMPPGKIKKDHDAIDRAHHRANGTGDYEGKANPGSSRMSLGNMIRKYVKLIQHHAETPRDAATIIHSFLQKN